jgi:hypothetical protein
MPNTPARVQNGVCRQAQELCAGFRTERRASPCASRRNLSSTICCAAPVTYSLFPVPYSLFPVPCSLSFPES